LQVRIRQPSLSFFGRAALEVQALEQSYRLCRFAALQQARREFDPHLSPRRKNQRSLSGSCHGF
jgi:hypothetical protein